MQTISFKARSLMIGAAIVALVIPIITFTLNKAQQDALITANQHTMEAYVYNLVAELDIENGQVFITPNALPPALSQSASGVVGLIYVDQALEWASPSAMEINSLPADIVPANLGEFYSTRYFLDDQEYLGLVLPLIFETAGAQVKVSVSTVQKIENITLQQNSFRQQLYLGMAVTAGVVLLAISISLLWIIRPITRLDKAVKRVESGDENQVNGEYPQELQTLVSDLNLLIEQQDKQTQRYSKSLSDLAHALKTPLAIIGSSELAQKPELQSQLININNIIDHQLKRVSTGANQVWQKPVDIKPILMKLTTTMAKLYPNVQVSEQLVNVELRINESDLLEITGNLLDNACKAASHNVSISNEYNANQVKVIVEDDGQGVDPKQADTIFNRGKRLDTYESGHGVGLAIVDDLVKAYNGAIFVKRSSLGGAKFELIFNRAGSSASRF